MKLLLVRDYMKHKRGETISLLHWTGSKLLRAHSALWVEAEPGDPVWPNGGPPQVFRAARPDVDKMVHASINK
jgi:hypothetical protein